MLIDNVCSDVPNAFWHRKKHIVDLPYVKDFNEKNIPTKACPIQMNAETVEFCKKEISDLLEKKLIRNSKMMFSQDAGMLNGGTGFLTLILLLTMLKGTSLLHMFLH